MFSDNFKAHGSDEMRYLKRALLTRGRITIDYFLYSKNAINFFKIVQLETDKNLPYAIKAMERLLNIIEDLIELPNLERLFKKIIEEVCLENMEFEPDEKTGYVKIKKVY